LGGVIWSWQDFHFSLFRPLSTYFLRSLFETRGVRVRILFPLLLTAGFERLLYGEQPVSGGALHYYLAVGGSLLAIESGQGKGTFALHARMAVYSWVPGAILELFHDHMISWMTPLYSFISIPPISILLYPASVFSLLTTGEIHPLLLRAWELWLDLLLSLAEQLPSFLVIDRRAFLPAAFVLIGFGLFRIAWPRITLSGVVLLVRILLPPPTPSRVVLFDVGQGDSALLQSGGRSELVDTGPERGADPSLWIRRLARNGVGRLDAVLLTHLDLDHRGGISSLASVIEITCLESHDPQGLRSGCAKLPRVGWFRSSRKGGNQWMAGIEFILAGGESYTALGDGDREQERSFVEWLGPGTLRSAPHRIWKAGHHGSRYSSDPLLIERLRPDEVWVSVGRRNPYRHPNLEALHRLVSRGAVLHRTDVEGDIVFSSKE
jgi:competence protein ComEC